MGERDAGNYQLDVDGRVRKVRKLFTVLPPGSKILDIGCSDGAILRPFARTHELHGVDHHLSFTSRAEANGMRAKVHDVSSGPLPYGDAEFDAVFCGETIEHQVDTDWVLAEANRVLKTGGTLVLTIPSIRTIVSLGMMIFLGLPPKYSARYRAPHFRDFTLKVGRIALENNGFEVRKIIGGCLWIPGCRWAASALGTLFPGWADTIIYLAIKRVDNPYSLDDAARLEIYGLHAKK